MDSITRKRTGREVRRDDCGVKKGEHRVEQLRERVWVAPGGVNVGVIVGDGGAVTLIDTGLNDTSARKVLRWVRDTLNGSVVAIVTTHGHADHFGGNAFVVKRTGAEVYAPAIDDAVLRYPLLQATSLFAGADPPRSMRTAFLVAEASPVDHIYAAGTFTVAGVELEAISLSGHSPNQMGILVDDVLFCADVVLPERALEKYRMPYLSSLTDHLHALDRVVHLPHDAAVPGHGPLLNHVGEAVAANRASVERVVELVLNACLEPAMPEEVLAIVLEQLGANVVDAPSYYLLHPTIFAYLAHLEGLGQIDHMVERGKSLWRTVK
jgi:glyoxylase-like metal-dependent hydrolase (beta-lactamase superfamily II)